MDKTLIEEMQARGLAARLHAALNSGMHWRQVDLESGAIRVEFPPDQKEVLRETAFMLREPMAEFCREAVIERLQRTHDKFIAASSKAEGEALKDAA